MPVWSSARRNRLTIASRSAADEPSGTRSLSWKFTPYAPRSARWCTASTGSSGGRVSWPNGSRPRLPTVQSPKVKRSSGVATNVSLMICTLPPGLDGDPGGQAPALPHLADVAHEREGAVEPPVLARRANGDVDPSGLHDTPEVETGERQDVGRDRERDRRRRPRLEADARDPAQLLQRPGDTRHGVADVEL